MGGTNVRRMTMSIERGIGLLVGAIVLIVLILFLARLLGVVL